MTLEEIKIITGLKNNVDSVLFVFLFSFNLNSSINNTLPQVLLITKTSQPISAQLSSFAVQRHSCFHSHLQICVLTVILAACWAAPQDARSATVLRYDNENIGVDGYKYGYETSNGISHDEEGTLQNIGSENESIDVHGSYKYTDEASGKVVTVTYVSGENGFRPKITIS